MEKNMKPKKCRIHDACIYSGQTGCLRNKIQTESSSLDLIKDTFIIAKNQIEARNNKKMVKQRIKPRINFRSLLQYIMKVVKPKKGKGSYKRTKKVNIDAN